MSGLVIPQPQTRLAFRVWQFDEAALTLLSLREPGPKSNWLARAMAYPNGGWPHDRVLTAECAWMGKPPPDHRKRKKGKGKGGEEEDEEQRLHGRVPDPDCTCGIYATTDRAVLSGYLRPPQVSVVGIVELGGLISTAEQGFRAECARIAGVLLVDEQVTEPHPVLHELAGAYNVPAIVPPWDDEAGFDPEFYRDQVTGIGAEAEMFLRLVTGLD
jgi:hypothetical protein